MKIFICFAFSFLLSACGQVASLSDTSSLNQTLTIQTMALTGIQVGKVNTGISITGGAPPFVFSASDGAFPEGLSINASTGVISGTIPSTQSGKSFAVTIKVTDSGDVSASRTFAGLVTAGGSTITLHTTELATITAGIGYSFGLAVSGGTEPFTFKVTSGAIPAGLTLDSATGIISGRPTAATSNQAYAITMMVADSTGLTASKTYLGTVAASASSSMSIVTNSVPAPTAGSSYLASIGVTGGTSPYTFSVSSGALPTGLSLNTSSGLISGTVAHATQSSSYLFTINVADTTGLSASKVYSGFVTAYTTSIVPSTLASPIPGASYSATLSTISGQAPYTYTITTGSLPSGLSLNGSTGVLTGTVAEAEAGLTKNFTVRSTDANNVQTSTAFALTTGAFSVSVSNASLANAIEGAAYSNSSTVLSATGGTAPYTFEYSGALPTGVGLTSSGTFFGTPSTGTGALAAGTTYTIYVRARDALNQTSAQKTLTITVTIDTPVVGATALSNATLGVAYSQTITASGGRPPYTYAVASGTLPTGLSLSTAGLLSGTATATSACPANAFNITATDSLGQVSATSNKCITTVDGVLISKTSFAPVIIGVSYSDTVTASGGTAPYAYSASGLPAGVTLHPTTGVLSGFTSATSGDYSVYITVSDSNATPLSATRSYTFTVRDPLSITSTTLPRAATGISYNSGAGFSIVATGGQTPYVFSITAGALPSGLSLSTAGVVSGTPAYSAASTNSGVYSVSIKATDAHGQVTASTVFALNVTVAPKINTSKLPIAVVNNAYSYDVPRIGGVNQFNGSAIATRLTWSVTGLPAGLTYGATTGRIYGTPTTNAASPYSITVSVTDQHGFTGSKVLSLTVNSAGKNLDMKAPRYSDPCVAGTANCLPYGHALGKLTNTSQQFLVYSRNDTATRSLQIAKVDETGRIPYASGNVTSINVPLLAMVGNVGDINIGDLDQDGFKDIVFSDYTNKNLCSMWGSATVNSTGMPTGYTNASMNCWPLPAGGHANNYPWYFKIATNLRPDAINNGKADVIVQSSQNSNQQASVTVLKNSCALNGACTTEAARKVIFSGYVATTGNTTNASNVIAVADTTGFSVGRTIIGAGIPVNATISAINPNVSITISANANATVASSKISSYASIAFTGNTTSGSFTITGVSSTAGLQVGQLVGHANYPTGTYITTIVPGVSIGTSNSATATTGGASIIVVPISQHSTWMPTPSSTLGYFFGSIGVGFFDSAAPNPPTTYATSASKCPSIVFGGLQNTNTGISWLYMLRQGWTGTECQADFSQHTTTDEFNTLTGSRISDLITDDINNDGISDITVAYGGGLTNSTSVRTYLMPGGNTFSGATTVSPQLQSLGTTYTSAGKVTAYCPDGSLTCNYPSLLVTCNLEGTIGNVSNTGCLSLIPNQCSTPGCTTPFETSTPSLRMDYPAPPGQFHQIIKAPIVSSSFLTPTGTTVSGNATITGVSSMTGIVVGQLITGAGIPNYSYITSIGASTITINQNATASATVTLSIPAVPTLNDVMLIGIEYTNAEPYVVTYARNGSSTTDPLKADRMLNVFPASYIQPAEVGTMKLSDMNNDGVNDLFAYAVNQGFVGSYMSNLGGSTTYSLGSTIAANYLSNPTYYGCPYGAASCLPDPLFNTMGVNHGIPAGYHHQNSMDMMDINNDGIDDIVVAGYYSRGVSVALGTSTGQVGSSTLYDAGAGADVRPVGVAFGDLDQDGFPDIVVTGLNLTGVQAGFISWLKGNGDGTFQTAVSINQIINSCTDPRAVSVVDIDLDGRPEIATLCYTTQLLWVGRRHSDVSGTWVLQTGATINAAGGSNGTVMKWGRLNTNAATGLDVVVTGLDVTNSIRIINSVSLTVTSTVTGAFTMSSNAATYMPFYGYPSDVDIADFNADGLNDLLIGMQNQNGTQIGEIYYTCLSGITNGTCTRQAWGMENYNVGPVAAGDVNGDNLPEAFIGYKSTTSRLIMRTLLRVTNLSQ